MIVQSRAKPGLRQAEPDLQNYVHVEQPGSKTPMQKLVRRDFLKTSLLPAALPLLASQAVKVHAAEKEPAAAAEPPGIIDTNVHLFDWPFRSL